jgi:hypothetical protein
MFWTGLLIHLHLDLMAQKRPSLSATAELAQAVVSNLCNIVRIKDVKQGLEIPATAGHAPGTSST